MGEIKDETLRGLVMKVGLVSFLTAGLTVGIRETIKAHREREAQIQQIRNYQPTQKQLNTYRDRLNNTTDNPYRENQ